MLTWHYRRARMRRSARKTECLDSVRSAGGLTDGLRRIRDGSGRDDGNRTVFRASNDTRTDRNAMQRKV